MLHKKEGFKGQQTVIIPKSIIEQVKKDSLIKDLFITDIGFYPNAEFHYRERRKGASGNILIYCTNGIGWYETGTSLNRIQKHEVCIIPANVPHKYGADPQKPWTIYWMHLEGDKADLIFGKVANVIHLKSESPEFYLQRIRLFDDIFRNISITYNLEHIKYANFLVWNFLASVFYNNLYTHRNVNKKETIIDSSLEFMQNNVHKKLTLQEFASQAGLSVAQYSNIFNQKTSISPMNFYSQLKIQRSCQLLENPYKRIKEIAVELGFEDQFYFSRCFKKIMGVSPARFRESLHE